MRARTIGGAHVTVTTTHDLKVTATAVCGGCLWDLTETRTPHNSSRANEVLKEIALLVTREANNHASACRFEPTEPMDERIHGQLCSNTSES